MSFVWSSAVWMRVVNHSLSILRFVFTKGRLVAWGFAANFQSPRDDKQHYRNWTARTLVYSVAQSRRCIWGITNCRTKWPWGL